MIVVIKGRSKDLVTLFHQPLTELQSGIGGDHKHQTARKSNSWAPTPLASATELIFSLLLHTEMDHQEKPLACKKDGLFFHSFVQLIFGTHYSY